MLEKEEFAEYELNYINHIYECTQINNNEALIKEFKNWFVGICEKPEDRLLQLQRTQSIIVEGFYFLKFNGLSEAQSIVNCLYNVGLKKYLPELSGYITHERLDKTASFVYIFKFKQ